MISRDVVTKDQRLVKTACLESVQKMALAFLLLAFVLVPLLSAWSVWRYANYRKTPWYVLCTTLVGWTASFSIVILLPLDIASVSVSMQGLC